MTDDIEIEIDLDLASLISKLLNDQTFINGMADLIRTNILRNARAYGTALGGYAGTSSRAQQTSPVFNGHWNSAGVWVRG
jgi:hypothetical protein